MTTLLIDADTLVYKAGQRAEQVIQWDESLFTLHAELDDGISEFNQIVDRMRDELEADRIVMALTDYSVPNWRNGVYPDYKKERHEGNKRRPILWGPLRDFIHAEAGDQWETFQRPSLEGDDVLGILLTGKRIKGKKICVSIDKDMNTLPGLHLSYDNAFKADGVLSDHVYEVTQEEADRFHMVQSLAGDATDGYGGCPGVGMIRAQRFLEEGAVLVPHEHEFKRGARKGDTEIRWLPGDPGTEWEVVVSVYESYGLTAEDALRNARVARICRVDDYDFQKKEVRLWNP